MKYVNSKAWPWPVLREGSSDYSRCEFQVEIVAEIAEGSTKTNFTADFDLSDQALLAEVDRGRAAYVLLVVCPTTHFRVAVKSGDPQIRWGPDHGQLAERVEVSPFLVACADIPEFSSENWHPDWQEEPFRIESGSVLALEPPSLFWIQPAEEALQDTVFRTSEDSEQAQGEWSQFLLDDYAILRFHPSDFERFKKARAQAKASGTSEYIMNGVYLPAVASLLTEVDKDVEQYQEYRWFTAVQDALSRLKARPLGENDANPDRLVDAQQILKRPFARSPFLEDAGDQS